MNNITINQFKSIIPFSWSKETCYTPWQEKWSKENPAFGQCYVTSRLFQNLFGGELLKAKDTSGSSHYWNHLNGKDYDFTKIQYLEGEIFIDKEFFTKTKDDERLNILTNNFFKKVLEVEGFPIVYDWYDEPSTKYENHKHQGKVSFFVLEGSVAFSGEINKTVSKGERIDVPVGVEHSAIVGDDGCKYVVGQEIEGDA